jgi:RNA polymerase sigma factor (sigma-70 family)
MRTEDGYFISKCLNGDPAAFGFLVDKYKACVYALAYARLRNFHDAEDATQDVFLTAYRKLNTLKRYDNFRAWLYSITSNHCKMLLRSQANRPDRDFMEDQSPEVIDNPSIDSHRESLANEMLNDLTEMLNQALKSLPEIYHQVLALRYLGGMSNYEIAEFLGISQVAIRQRLSRARAELKEGMLAMMSRTYEQKRLPVSFTFRIVEMVKQIRVQPISMTKGLSLGLSLTAGIIAIVFGIGQHLNLTNPLEALTGYTSSSESKVLKVGEFPVDMLKVSNISVLSNNHGNGYGLGSEIPSLQNALFMAPQVGDTWTKKVDMPTARCELSAGVVNGKIYVIGGYGDKGVLPTVEEYDPVTDTWTQKADMPTARCFLSASSLNGKIYAIGGANNDVLSTVEEYDPVKDIWTRKADMPTARDWLSVSSVDGKIYAIGGLMWNPLHHLSTVEEYDPMTNSWKRKADLPRRIHTLSTSVVNGKIYAIGGVDNAVLLSTVYEYDPMKNTWTQKADMLTPRWKLCTSTVNGRIYAIGGTSDFNDRNILSTVEEYDPDADKWTKRTDMPTPREACISGAVNGKIYVIGGYDQNAWTFFSAVEEYDTGFAGESVQPKGKLPTTWGDVRTAMSK